jgi:hypothetical protein
MLRILTTFFKQFIHDCIGVWMLRSSANLTCNASHCYLNRRETLRWTCDGHVDSLIFLDLQILIGRDRLLIFITYQKPVNLYLCILPGSAHPEKWSEASSLAVYVPTGYRTLT